MTQDRNKRHSMLTRRQLTAGAAGALALSFRTRSAPAATATIRQGYQTNIWGMATYYLLKSGYLDKHGIAVEEFAVPSGNLTMQQMVGASGRSRHICRSVIHHRQCQGWARCGRADRACRQDSPCHRP